MFIHPRRAHQPKGGRETPESVFWHRRRWLKVAGYSVGAGLAGAAAFTGWRSWHGTDQQVLSSGESDRTFDLQSSDIRMRFSTHDFTMGVAKPRAAAAARYTNFYEFTRYKWTWRLVPRFEPHPWQLEVVGLCRRPVTLDLEQLHRRYAQHFVERQYRHRCVEKWAMAVPWTGMRLSQLIQDADPLPSATHLRFVSFQRPEQAANQRQQAVYPWPYREGLTLDEAQNDLTLLATGVYGRPLLKQHGAPIRLVVPWKYGYKSIKSIQRIEFTDSQPATFWSTLRPAAYPFESNVDPQVARPWPQAEEWMLGTGERYPTEYLNGYQEHVGHLYRRRGGPVHDARP